MPASKSRFPSYGTSIGNYGFPTLREIRKREAAESNNARENAVTISIARKSNPRKP